jgi:cytochrome d ubiquinol oxidase subunit II
MTDLVSLVALAEEPIFGLPLTEIWYVLTFFILAMFLALDGFDFGVGAIFSRREDEHEREQMLAAIGPFWDGNEVWLVVFGGALFATFPIIYSTLFSRYYLLMFAILGALIVRGLAPEMYEQRDDPEWHRIWGMAFIGGSIAAPLFLGMFVGNWVTGANTGFSLTGVVVGLAVVALSVVSGAGWLGIKVRGELQEYVQRIGPRAVVGYLGLVVVALGLFATQNSLRADLLTVPAVALVVLSVVLGGVYAYAMREGRFYVAFGSASAMVFGLVTLVAYLLYPVIDPVTGLTVDEAVVSVMPLNVMTIFAVPLLLMVFGYFVVLYSSFSGPVEAGEAY